MAPGQEERVYFFILKGGLGLAGAELLCQGMFTNALKGRGCARGAGFVPTHCTSPAANERRAGGQSGMLVLAETRPKCGVQGEYHPRFCKVELLHCSI